MIDRIIAEIERYRDSLDSYHDRHVIFQILTIIRGIKDAEEDDMK